MSVNNPPWHILGAGAMGSLWGAKLALAGEQVILLLRNQARLDEFQSGGGLLLEQQGKTLSIPVDAAIAGRQEQKIKRLMVCTKTFDTLEALERLRDHLDENALVILMQNGLGVQQQAQLRFKHLPLICAITTEGAYRKNRFHIVYAGTGYTRLGSLDSDPAKVQAGLAKLLAPLTNNRTLNASWDNDMLRSLWLKLAVNCAINPVTALMGCKTGMLLDKPKKMSEIRAACAEIEPLLCALNINLHHELYDQVLQIMQATAANYSSMCQDIRNGRRTEIDAITGYLCEQARKFQLETPLNNSFYERIKALEPEAE